MAVAQDTQLEDYKFDTLQSTINGFVSALQAPLHGEIPTLLAMRPYDTEGLLKVYNNCEAGAGEQDEVYHRDMGTEEPSATMSATPEKAVLYITDHIATAHAGAWRLLRCDTFGDPRRLAFTAE
ncbi:hypothetical protein BDR22DRAFT_820020 [Usnea florida]